MSVLTVVAVCILVLQGSHAACDDFVSESSITCQLLFDHFQAALLARRLNLYNLRKTFFPLTRAPPSLVNVSYHISIAPVTDKACPGSATNETLLPGNATEIDKNFAWTDKTVYSIFHPAHINRLQPQLVQMLIVELEISSSALVALRWDGAGPILTLRLLLDPVLLPCRPTYSQLFATLTDITALLKVYASTQENITDWDNGDQQAHVISGLIFSPQWYIYTDLLYPYSSQLPAINAIFSIILSLALSITIYHFIWTKIPSSPRKKNFLLKQTLLWTAVILILQDDIIILLFEVRTLQAWCRAGTCSDPAAFAKIFLLVYILLFNGIFFTVFVMYHFRRKLHLKRHLLPGIQVFLTGVPLVSMLAALIVLIFRLFIKPCRHRFKYVHHGLIHVSETLHYFISFPKWMLWNGFKVVKFIIMFLPFSTIFTFLALTIFSVIPVLLQALVYPFRILAAYSFTLSNIMILFLVTFFVAFYWQKKGISNTSAKLCFLLTLPTLTLVFIFMINIPFMSLYQLLSSGTLTNNPIMLGIISIAPSLLLSSPLVWILKNKVFPAFVEVKTESEEERGEDGERVRSGEERVGKAVHIAEREDTVVQNPTRVEQDLEQQPSQGETEMYDYVDNVQ